MSVMFHRKRGRGRKVPFFGHQRKTTHLPEKGIIARIKKCWLHNEQAAKMAPSLLKLSLSLYLPVETREESMPARQLRTVHRFLNAGAHRPASVAFVHRILILVLSSLSRGRHRQSPRKSNSIKRHRKDMKKVASRSTSRDSQLWERQNAEHRVRNKNCP